MTNNGTMNGHQPQASGLWLPPGLQNPQPRTAAPKSTPKPTAKPAAEPTNRPATPTRPSAASTADTVTRSEPQAQQPSAEPVRAASTPEEIRQRYEEAWAKEEARIRAESTDRPSNALGWLVAILAGVMSLEGFRLFGQLLDWPPIGTLPYVEIVIAPLVVLWFTIDVIALVAMRQWLNPAFSTATRRLGMQVSVAALGISVLINALGHGAHGGALAWFAVPAAALPPALLWAVLYLRDRRVRDMHQQLADARERHEKALERALAGTTPERHAGAPRGNRPARTTITPSKSTGATKTSKADKHGKQGKTDIELVEALRALDAEHGRPVGHHIAMKAFGIGRSRFDRIRAQANQTTNDRAERPTND